MSGLESIPGMPASEWHEIEFEARLAAADDALVNEDYEGFEEHIIAGLDASMLSLKEGLREIREKYGINR